MNKRSVVGVEIPADLTDPRLSAADLETHRAALQAKFDEVKIEGTSALPKRAELIVAMNDIRTEVDNRALLAAQDAQAAELAAPAAVVAEAVPAVEPVESVQVTQPAVPAPTASGVTVAPGSTVVVAAAETPEQEAARVAAARAVLAAGGTDFSQTPAEQAPTAAGGTKVKTAAWQPYGGAGMADVPTAALSDEGWGERFQGAFDAVREAGSRPIGNGGKMTAVKIAGYQAGGFVNIDEMAGPHQSNGSNSDIIRAALAKTVERHANRDEKDPKKAGFCAPAQVIRALPDAGDYSTPIRDAITFVPSAAMNFTFNGRLTMLSSVGAVTDWDDTDQAAVDPDDSSTWKTCLAFDCADAVTTDCDDWTVACATWPLAMSLSNPERVADVKRKIERVYARRIEQKLRSAIKSIAVTVGPFAMKYSSLPDLVYAINVALNYIGYTERLDDAPYVAILDEEMIWNLWTDLARVAFGTGRDLEEPIAYILKRTKLTGVILAEDRIPGGYGTATGQSPSIGNPYTNNLLGTEGGSQAAYEIVKSFESQLVPLNEVFAWGTGEIRAGAQQDFNLMRQNRMASFVEEAICLTKYGDHPWVNLQTVLCPTGSRTAWTTPVACGTGGGSI